MGDLEDEPVADGADGQGPSVAQTPEGSTHIRKHILVMAPMKGFVVKEYCGDGEGQGIPQKPHHATDCTQEIYLGGGGHKLAASAWGMETVADQVMMNGRLLGVGCGACAQEMQ